MFAVDAPTGRLLWSSAQVSGVKKPVILAVVVAENAVYVGRLFGRIGAAARVDLAARDPDTGGLLPWHAPAPHGSSNSPLGGVGRLALSDTRLYFSGNFGRVGRSARPAGVAAVRATAA